MKRPCFYYLSMRACMRKSAVVFSVSDKNIRRMQIVTFYLLIVYICLQYCSICLLYYAFGLQYYLLYVHTMTNRNNSITVRDTLLDVYSCYLENEEFPFYFFIGCIDKAVSNLGVSAQYMINLSKEIDRLCYYTPPPSLPFTSYSLSFYLDFVSFFIFLGFLGFKW